MKIQITEKQDLCLDSPKPMTTIEEIHATGLLQQDNNGLLIQGNNLDTMNSLLERYQGKIKLIYIDPPYMTGLDFKTKDGSFAYSDKFTLSEYLQFIYDRLSLMKLLLSDDGSIYVHVDYRTSAHIRLLMDEVFGAENFRNEIIWCYRSGGVSKVFSLARKHDVILFYSKTSQFKINTLYERQYLNKPFMGSKVDANGKYYVDTILRDVLDGEINIVEKNQVNIHNLRPVLNLSSERTGYPTQKPEGLLSILLKIASNEGDLVADFFCGSGTTIAVSQKLNRSWIGVDIGEEAICTIRSRLIALDAAFTIKKI